MPFPLTPLLDAFNRADIDPLDGSWAVGQAEGAFALKIVSNVVAAHASNNCNSYYTVKFGADQEAYVDVPTLPVTTERVGIGLRATSNADHTAPPTTTTTDCYLFIIDGTGAWEIRRYVAGQISAGTGRTTLTSGTTTLTAGDTLGFRASGIGATVTLEAWILHGGTWILLASFADSDAARVVTDGWTFLWEEQITSRLDNFGAGATPVFSTRPLRIPNRMVGPMALRHSFRQPTPIWLPASAATDFNDAGTGTITLSGASAESQTHSSSATGTITLSGSGSQSQTHTASGSGTITLSGTGSESQAHSRSAAGTLTLSGTGLESQTHSRSAAGTITLSGAAAESQTHTRSGSGSLTLSGTGSQSQTHTNTAAGTIVFSGTGLEIYQPPGGGPSAPPDTLDQLHQIATWSD